MNLLIDGMFDVHRAGCVMPQLSNADGMQSGVLFGFLRVIRHYHGLFQGKLHIVWEGHPGTRIELHPGYKEGRKKISNEMITQINALRNIITCLGINQYRNPNWEADDVLATLALYHADKKGEPVIIVTGDDDLLQCVNDAKNIRVYNPRFKIMYDEQRVHDKYGVPPRKLSMLWAIEGDPSDGIPGVKGLGEIYIAEIVAKHPNLEELFKDLEARPAVNKKDVLLRAAKDQVMLNIDLIRLREDLEVEKTAGIKNQPEVAKIMQEYQLYSMLRKVEAWMELA